VARGQCGDRKARDRNSVGEIERADLGRDLETNRIVRLDGTGKVEFDAEGAELDGNGTCASGGCPLNDRIRELTAGEEVRRLPADGHQIRFGEDLEDILCLEVLNGGTEVQIRAEEEDVEQAAHVEGAGGALTVCADCAGN
jgi:hypothetical protein